MGVGGLTGFGEGSDVGPAEGRDEGEPLGEPLGEALGEPDGIALGPFIMQVRKEKKIMKLMYFFRSLRHRFFFFAIVKRL